MSKEKLKHFSKYHLLPVVGIPALVACVFSNNASASEPYWSNVAEGAVVASPNVVVERTSSYDKNCDGIEDTGFVPEVYLNSGECAYLGVGVRNIGGAAAASNRVNVRVMVPRGTEIIAVSGDIPQTLEAGQTASMIYHVRMK